MNTRTIVALSMLLFLSAPLLYEARAQEPYPIVDTRQGHCYDAKVATSCPVESQRFYGQDAQYVGNEPRYRDNGNGTVTDLVTGLMWQKDPGEKMTFLQAVAEATKLRLAGYTDWRLPSVKELYSLILFDGTDPSVCATGTCSAVPFIDARTFDFRYGDASAGERAIDSQYASSTKYVSTTMRGTETMFGVNFADGRIKGYPTGPMPGQSAGKRFFVHYVRGKTDYGINALVDNADGTITDRATGLTWMQADSGTGMNWEDALAYCEDSSISGHNDWRLPNAKELQSIVDYRRSPATTDSAAIDPLFRVSVITNEAGEKDYPFYWSSTTHASSNGRGNTGVYLAFGRAMGNMRSTWMDVHGAGAQRSDPKTGRAADFPNGRGPQGDAIRINNFVRCVRGGGVHPEPDGTSTSRRPSMTFESSGTHLPTPSTRSGSPSSRRGGRGQPPPEAVKACSGLALGATCAFVTPYEARVQGTCATIATQLACVPKGGPPKR
jgi:hypothetical protein